MVTFSAANIDSTGHDPRGREHRPAAPAVLNSILKIPHGMSMRKIALNLTSKICDPLPGVIASQNSTNLRIN